MKSTQAPPGSRESVPLPAAARAGRVSLEEALSRRRSVREFAAKPLPEAVLGQLLWAAQGITHPDGLRTAPSAGALYPLELYVATAAGFYHYNPRRHELERRSASDLRPALARAALEQESIRQAGAVIVFAAVVERIARKYGPARAPRYVFLEVGHAAQNVLLEATALGLGAVPVGAFHNVDVDRALSLPKDEEPVYLVPVGYPR